MRQKAGLAVVMATTVLVAGCINVDTLVTLNSDGSGTIEETMLMSKAALEQMKAMMAGMAGPEGSGAPPALFDEVKLRDKAAGYGAGVTYVSGEPLATDTGEGYKVVYAFSDINNLQLNQNPGDKLPSGPAAAAAPAPEKEFLTFQFTSGSPNALIINRPEPDSPSGGPPGGDSGQPASPVADPQAMAMMQQMFKDMKVRFAIKVQGAITETNATHREGNEVTVMEMDFNALLANPEKFQKLASVDSQRFEDLKEIVKDMPGMKVDLNNTLEIQFK